MADAVPTREIKRITPDQVLEAYAKTGLKPRRNGYFWPLCSSPEFACGIGACLAAEQEYLVGKYQHLTVSMDRIGISQSYRFGFVLGFDGDNRSSMSSDIEACHLGYADGKAAAAAVFAKETVDAP